MQIQINRSGFLGTSVLQDSVQTNSSLLLRLCVPFLHSRLECCVLSLHYCKIYSM